MPGMPSLCNEHVYLWQSRNPVEALHQCYMHEPHAKSCQVFAEAMLQCHVHEPHAKA